jgi:hypothetical protein
MPRTTVAAQERSVVSFDFLGRNFIQIFVERIRRMKGEETPIHKSLIQYIRPAFEIPFQTLCKRAMRRISKGIDDPNQID